MTLDEIGIKYGTDKASRVEVGLHFDEFGAHNSHGYLEHYDALLGHRRNEEIKIMEIGVQHGYGLWTFEEGFPLAEVWGVDNNFHVGQSQFARAKLIKADIDQLESRNAVIKMVGNCDLIIDDASHQNVQMKMLFNEFFPHVRSSGFYVIEDLICGYDPYYGGNNGGLPPSIMATVKSLVDQCQRDTPATIRSMHFFRDIVFIQKA